MSAFIPSVLLSVVRSLERPLRLAGLDVFARCSDSSAWRIADFDSEGSTYWVLGLEITFSRVPGLGLADLKLTRWQAMNGLARLSHAFGWDVFVAKDDVRCGLFDFDLKRLGSREFEFYGLGLHVIGSPLRLYR